MWSELLTPMCFTTVELSPGVRVIHVDALLFDEAVPVQRQDDRRVGAGYCGEGDGDERKMGRSELTFYAFEYAQL